MSVRAKVREISKIESASRLISKVGFGDGSLTKDLLSFAKKQKDELSDMAKTQRVSLVSNMLDCGDVSKVDIDGLTRELNYLKRKIGVYSVSE